MGKVAKEVCVDKEVTRVEERQECNQVLKPVCVPVSREECKTVPGVERVVNYRVCEDQMQEVCEEVPIEVCGDFERKKSKQTCRNVPVKTCKPVAKEDCEEVVERKCKQVVVPSC